MSCNEVAPPARISAMIGAILLATRSFGNTENRCCRGGAGFIRQLNVFMRTTHLTSPFGHRQWRISDTAIIVVPSARKKTIGLRRNGVEAARFVPPKAD